MTKPKAQQTTAKAQQSSADKAQTQSAAAKEREAQRQEEFEAAQEQAAENRRVLVVEDGYQGRPSGEKMINPGMYFEGDERLHNCEALLVRNGLAYWADSVSPKQRRQMLQEANFPRMAYDNIPDGFRGVERAAGQKEHGLLSPDEVAAMNSPGYEPEPDRDELGRTLPPAPDGFRGLVTNPDGTQTHAGADNDETQYAPEGQRPIIGTTNPERRVPVAPTVTPDERQRLKKADSE